MGRSLMTTRLALPTDAELADRPVTVMGLGRFGGGVGVATWLATRGARVLVTDLASTEELASSVEALRPLIDDGRIALRLA